MVCTFATTFRVGCNEPMKPINWKTVQVIMNILSEKVLQLREVGRPEAGDLRGNRKYCRRMIRICAISQYSPDPIPA
jgi:hypothetical protein